MILESRSIIFSEEELVIALKPLLSSRELSEDYEPQEILTGLDTDGDVVVTYKGEDAGEVIFESQELGAAILNHCIESEIPLPRGSYKELALRGDHVALIVRIETRGSAH
ncbi:hypothetical protein QGN29_07055 [Temperatibacter marinus]|uniref:Uncharacterized protein n=1 Tax=Temperatibacter marinus TaxID=1456591 RepID=A0AA52EKF7_9PROT|nr:hypothetical protein [Temperatibacter marinus]WND04129.1 hypothetical protein QGN29_07055 [Temperatibacter marinus]